MKSKQIIIESTDEKGSALFIIFLTIGLIAAFTYTVNLAMRVSDSSAATHHADSYADQWINLGAQVEAAVTRMRSINRCKVGDINFRDLNNNISNNATSPSDGSCKLTDPAGGGMQPFAYIWPYEWVNTASPSIPSFNIYMAPVEGFGETDADLNTVTDYEFMMGLYDAKTEICAALNKKAGITTSTFAISMPNYSQYSGVSRANAVLNGLFTNKKYGCYSSGAVSFLYYIVLVQ